ncbi:MAG: HlyD family efflux transporter periplasmic adaptor subunit, partial [Pseudomonadota bacterium]
MNRQILWSLLLVGGAVLIGGVLVMARPQPAEEERVEEVPLVQAVPLKEASGAIPVLGSGTVQAREEVTVGFEVGGRITYVNPAFREGGVVAAGATLLRVDESDYQNNVQIAQADVAAQEVSVLQAEEEVTIAQEELARFAVREQGRATGAQGETQILPPSSTDGSKASISPEEIIVEATAERGLATREPQLRSAEAARERARASLADARLSLSRTRVRAPFSGFVREESAAVGSLVQVGQALGSIVPTDAYEVRIALTAEEAALIPGLL